MVWQTARNVSIPIIGMGGICNWQDAVGIMAGADAVPQVQQILLIPAPIEILEGLRDYMKQRIQNLKAMKLV